MYIEHLSNLERANVDNFVTVWVGLGSDWRWQQSANTRRRNSGFAYAYLHFDGRHRDRM